MIQETIEEIEAKLLQEPKLSDEHRTELLALLATLKQEMRELSKTHADEAASIAGFTELSTHIATRTGKNRRLLALSLEGLTTSVAGLEKTHPRLVEIVNSICTTLSNLGI